MTSYQDWVSFITKSGLRVNLLSLFQWLPRSSHVYIYLCLETIGILSIVGALGVNKRARGNNDVCSAWQQNVYIFGEVAAIRKSIFSM